MKKGILGLMLMSFTCITIKGQTNVSGFISANTTWDLNGSPYIVIGNALLSHGYTLTINPGVVVKFNDSCALQIDGEMDAIGTPQNHITFTSNQINPHAGDWAKIHFSDTCVSAVFDSLGNYVSGCIMKYCDVMYGGGIGFGEIHIESSSPYISHCNISNSSAAGIYCDGSSYLLDSSNVNHCAGYGLYFLNQSLNSTVLNIIGDTIENNTGGINFATYNVNFHTSICNNVFISNNGLAVIYFESDLYTNVRISGNDFINNDANGVIRVNESLFTDTIECNKFIHNQTTLGCISTTGGSSGVIVNNTFNSNNSTGDAVIRVYCSDGQNLIFANNYLAYNTATHSICEFTPVLVNTPYLQIDSNVFDKNIAASIVRLDGYVTNTGDLNFLYMKFNDFNDTTQIEVYNNIPYGSPDIYADSNYWGTTNTTYINSAIYDYFQYANLSVVYYSPPLSFAVEIDTSCAPNIVITGIKPINEQKNSSVLLYPNPFSTSTTLIINGVETPLMASLQLKIYDVYGQEVRNIYVGTNKQITINREELASGMYFYQLVNNTKEVVATGKMVIN